MDEHSEARWMVISKTCGLDISGSCFDWDTAQVELLTSALATLGPVCFFSEFRYSYWVHTRDVLASRTL